jgi:predicted DNA-binding transcriptional regulator AlpA
VGDQRPLATPEQVSTFLGVPIKTLHQWNYRSVGPRALKVGRHLRYRWAEVEKWLDERPSKRVA